MAGRRRGWLSRNNWCSEATMEVPLVEFSPLRDDCLLSGWVVEAPALVAFGIAQEDAFLHMRSKALPLVLLHKHIGRAPEYPENAEIWFALVPGLVRRHARK